MTYKEKDAESNKFEKFFKANDVSTIDNSWRTTAIFSEEESLKNENEKFLSDEFIYRAMTKLNLTSELFVTGGFRKPNVRKNLFENNYEREKVLSCCSTNFMTVHE